MGWTRLFHATLTHLVVHVIDGHLPGCGGLVGVPCPGLALVLRLLCGASGGCMAKEDERKPSR